MIVELTDHEAAYLRELVQQDVETNTRIVANPTPFARLGSVMDTEEIVQAIHGEQLEWGRSVLQKLDKE